MAYFFVADVGIFGINLIVWGGILILLLMTKKVRLPKLKGLFRSRYIGTERFSALRRSAVQIGSTK